MKISKASKTYSPNYKNDCILSNGGSRKYLQHFPPQNVAEAYGRKSYQQVFGRGG